MLLALAASSEDALSDPAADPFVLVFGTLTVGAPSSGCLFGRPRFRVLEDPAPAPAAPTCTAAPTCAAPIKKNRHTDNKKLKEIQIKLIKALAARQPPITQHVIIHDDIDEDNDLEVSYDLEEDVTPSEVQGSEYMHSTYKQPLHY